MVPQRHRAISHFALLVFFHSLSLCFLVNSQGIKLSGDVDLQIQPWALRLLPVTLPARVAVPNVHVQYDFLHLQISNYNSVTGETYLTSNYSLSAYGLRFENSTFFENGVRADRVRMYTTLPNNLTVSVMVDKFAQDTYKSYFGWKMPLLSRGVKISIRIDNVPENSDLKSVYSRIHVVLRIVVRMRPHPNPLLRSPIAGHPLIRLNETLNSTLASVYSPSFTALYIQDRDVDISVSHLNGIACFSPVAPDHYHNTEFSLIPIERQLRSALPAVEPVEAVVNSILANALAALAANVPFYDVELPIRISVDRYRCSENLDSYEYDPDISVLFVTPIDIEGPSATPSTLQAAIDDNNSARLAGIIVGCILGLAAIGLFVAIIASRRVRRKLIPALTAYEGPRITDESREALKN